MWKDKLRELPFAYEKDIGNYLEQIVKSFIEKEIIEKLIEDIPDKMDILYTVHLKQRLKAKWLT